MVNILDFQLTIIQFFFVKKSLPYSLPNVLRLCWDYLLTFFILLSLYHIILCIILFIYTIKSRTLPIPMKPIDSNSCWLIVTRIIAESQQDNYQQRQSQELTKLLSNTKSQTVYIHSLRRNRRRRNRRRRRSSPSFPFLLPVRGGGP